MSSEAAFFVPDPDLVLKNQSLPYSLYINSSILEEREHFVRIFPKGDILTDADWVLLKGKYVQVYLSETERASYLKAACTRLGKTEEEQVGILKNSAISHLDQIFVAQGELSAQIVNRTLDGCRQTVEGFVDLIKGYDLSRLHELIGSLSFHDFYTYDHSINVSMYCILIYQLFYPDADDKAVINAGMSGFLHDIGKIKISNRILNKVGKLSDTEFQEIKRHPQYGKEYLSVEGVQGPKGADVNVIREVVYQHHENYDGTGYPSRLKGEEIHALARIAAIADFFDAITTKRSYAEVLSVEEALDLMGKAKGKKLDPKFFNVFYSHMKEKYKVKECGIHLEDDFDPCQPHLKLTKPK